MAMVRYYFTALNLLFIGAIVYFGVNAFYLTTAARLESESPLPAMQQQAAKNQEQRSRPFSHYNAIVSRNLFDTKASVETTPKAVDVEGLEQTRLKLKLWGTVSGDEKEAYAVIEEGANRTQNLYRVGDTIQNATVKIILREKVVLSVNGRDEILELEEAKSRRAVASGPYRPVAASPAASPRSAPMRTQKITLRRDQIESAIQDVSQLMSEVNIRPHFHQGQPDGMMLSRIKPNSLFMRMGLRNGDVITGVNEEAIQSVDDALSFYESLKQADTVALQLKRGGRERRIEYTIR